MTTQFLSRVERSLQADPNAAATPGAYTSGSTLKKSLPGFAPFSSNTKRIVATAVPPEEGPAPGSYDLAQDLIKKTSYGSGTYGSQTKRFTEGRTGEGPGPGSYVLPTEFKSKKKMLHRGHGLGSGNQGKPNRALSEALAAAGNRVPPSIPTRFQSYGYEVTDAGDLQLQEPLYPVYQGSGDSAVGPGDYEPKDTIRFKKAPTAQFGKMAERGSLDKMAAKESAAPGPGYYNFRSDFDLPEEGNTFTDTSFLMQLTAARKKQSAVFESRTARDSLMQDIKRKLHEPGPGAYTLPATLSAPEKRPANKQFFASSGERFADPLPRSMRITTAPGSYTPITSDFDKMRLANMKRQKMTGRSGWARNIAFATTESRFHLPGGAVNDVPPPSTYTPKGGLSDSLPGQNPRGGAFGAKEARFKPAKTNFDPVRDPYSRATQELNQDLAHILPRAGREQQVYGGKSGQGARSPGARSRPAFTSMFAPSEHERLKPPRTPPGPPPGSYDTAPKWNKVGTSVMAPAVGQSRKTVQDTRPGPGEYKLPSSFQSSLNRRNPKQVMMSGGARDTMELLRGSKERTPGPGDYDPTPFDGSMIKASHNILLSENTYR